MPFKQPTTTYEEARRASRAVRDRIQPKGNAPDAQPSVAIAPDTAPSAAITPVISPKPTAKPNPVAPAPVAPETIKTVASTPSAQASMLTPKPATAVAAKGHATQSGRKIMLSLSVPFPAPGVSETFDAIASHHDGNTAMKTLIKRAMPAYEERLRTGRMSGVPEDYPAGDDATDTTRMMDAELINAARQHFDPFGVLSMRALARKIACSALAALFAEERKS